MIYILSLWGSTLIIPRIPQKVKCFLGLFCFFSPHLSCLCRLSSSYGDAFLNHAAKIIIKRTFCWSKITNNSFCQVEVAKTCALRGPHEIIVRPKGDKNFVRSLVNAIRLPNASAKVLLKWLFSMARMHYRM